MGCVFAIVNLKSYSLRLGFSGISSGKASGLRFTSGMSGMFVLFACINFRHAVSSFLFPTGLPIIISVIQPCTVLICRNNLIQIQVIVFSDICTVPRRKSSFLCFPKETFADIHRSSFFVSYSTILHLYPWISRQIYRPIHYFILCYRFILFHPLNLHKPSSTSIHMIIVSFQPIRYRISIWIWSTFVIFW